MAPGARLQPTPAGFFPAFARVWVTRCEQGECDAVGAEITFPAAFLAGLISFLSPYVLPLVPPYLGFLGGATLDQMTGEEGDGVTAEIYRRVLTGSYVMMGLSALLLAVSGNVPVALIYVIIAGVAVGVWSPIAAVYAQEIFPPERVATLLGTQRMVGGIGGALGPLVAGIVAESTGSRAPTIAIIVVGALAGAVILEVGTRRATRELNPSAQPSSGG